MDAIRAVINGHCKRFTPLMNKQKILYRENLRQIVIQKTQKGWWTRNS